MSKIEWWDVCKEVKPDLTWEAYEALWESFEMYKHWKRLQ